MGWFEEWSALHRSFESAGLSDTRTMNCAYNNGVKRLEDLTKYTERELLEWPNFGRKSLNLVKEALASVGLALDPGDLGDDTLRLLIEASTRTREELRRAGDNHKAMLAAIEVRRAELKAQRPIAQRQVV